MLKRKQLLILLFSLVLMLAACGGQSSDTSSSNENNSSSASNESSTETTETQNGPSPLDEPVDIKIGYPTQGASMLPIWVAKEAGFLEKYGVNAELIYIAGTPKVQETLNGGGIEVGLTGIDPVGKSKVAGVESVIFAAVADRNALYIYGQKEYEGKNLAEEMKGKKIISAAEGSLYDHLVKSLIQDNGLTPYEDVDIIHMGGEGDRTAAFLKGDGDFYIVAPPTTFKMDEMGYPQLHDFKEKEVLNSGLAMKKDYYDENQQLAEVLVAALAEANAYIVENKEETIKIIQEYTGIDDQELAEKTYDVNVDIIPKKPYVSDESAQFFLDLSDSEEVRAMKPSDVVDMSIVEKLDEEGFFDSLYE